MSNHHLNQIPNYGYFDTLVYTVILNLKTTILNK
jgi:hypothetical protein